LIKVFRALENWAVQYFSVTTVSFYPAEEVFDSYIFSEDLQPAANSEWKVKGKIRGA